MGWKIFIWEKVDGATDEYHEEGGVVIIAKSEKGTRKIADKSKSCSIRNDEKVNYVYKLSEDVEEKMIVFPDAGCC